jgi:hypothetical protein
MNGSAFLLVVVGLLLFYVVISDKWFCLEGCAACLSGKLAGGSIGTGVQGTGAAPVTGAGAAGKIGTGVGGSVLGKLPIYNGF